MPFAYTSEGSKLGRTHHLYPLYAILYKSLPTSVAYKPTSSDRLPASIKLTSTTRTTSASTSTSKKEEKEKRQRACHSNTENPPLLTENGCTLRPQPKPINQGCTERRCACTPTEADGT